MCNCYQCNTPEGAEPEDYMRKKGYLLKDKNGQYYNEEDFSYLVETDEPRPHSKATAESIAAVNKDIELVEVELE